jgi:hypothetical protein
MNEKNYRTRISSIEEGHNVDVVCLIDPPGAVQVWIDGKLSGVTEGDYEDGQYLVKGLLAQCPRLPLDQGITLQQPK